MRRYVNCVCCARALTHACHHLRVDRRDQYRKCARKTSSCLRCRCGCFVAATAMIAMAKPTPKQQKKQQGSAAHSRTRAHTFNTACRHSVAAASYRPFKLHTNYCKIYSYMMDALARGKHCCQWSIREAAVASIHTTHTQPDMFTRVRARVSNGCMANA